MLEFLKYLKEQLPDTAYNTYFLESLKEENIANIEDYTPAKYKEYFNSFKKNFYKYYYIYNITTKKLNAQLTKIILTNLYINLATLQKELDNKNNENKALKQQIILLDLDLNKKNNTLNKLKKENSILKSKYKIMLAINIITIFILFIALLTIK